MKLSEMLRGCEPGRLQIVGNMAVLPLVSELIWDDLVSPANTLPDGGNTRAKAEPRLTADVGTRTSYGTMVFGNRDQERDMIIPSHAGYLTKERAQDHAMSTAGIVRKGLTKAYRNACCVQSTQGGLMSMTQREMIILPWQLRAEATATRRSVSYSKLWDAIGKYNRSYDVRDHGGHLEMFFSKYAQQLEQFVAEFEPVAKQVGAILFVDGKLVGIERVPNYRYWRAVWPALIRECYGSLALLTRDAGKAPRQPQIQESLRLDRIKTLEDLEAELRAVQDREDEKARAMIRDIGKTDFIMDDDEVDGTLTVRTISDSDKRFSGQVVQRDGVPVVYVSLVTTQYYHKHGKWHEASAFSV